jgi:hypothetical protein
MEATMGDKPVADLVEAKELLITLTKQAVTEPTSLNLAVQILLRDYIERARHAKQDADKLASQ